MINLYATQNTIRNNNWPKIITEYTVNYKTKASYEVYNSYLSYVFQYETKDNKKGGSITDKICDLWAHNTDFRVTNLIIFTEFKKF